VKTYLEEEYSEEKRSKTVKEVRKDGKVRGVYILPFSPSISILVSLTS
jgi:hypothetical protein